MFCKKSQYFFCVLPYLLFQSILVQCLPCLWYILIDRICEMVTVMEVNHQVHIQLLDSFCHFKDILAITQSQHTFLSTKFPSVCLFLWLTPHRILRWIYKHSQAHRCCAHTFQRLEWIYMLPGFVSPRNSLFFQLTDPSKVNSISKILSHYILLF